MMVMINDGDYFGKTNLINIALSGRKINPFHKCFVSNDEVHKTQPESQMCEHHFCEYNKFSK